MTPFYDHAGITIYVGDCRDVLPQLTEPFDACVTDPPYHLTQASRKGSPRQKDPATPFGRTRLGSAGFMGKTWDGGDVAFQPGTWETILNALKPGAHAMAFGGTRTFHRLACAIEDGGFELRDTCCYLYGSGFPKSLDISKAIDKSLGAIREVVGSRQEHDIRRPLGGGEEKLMTSAGNRETLAIPVTNPATDAAKRFQGYGTALKPAWEPIILGMKPCDGTFAENASHHGVAGLNIDGSRIGTTKGVPASPPRHQDTRCHGKYGQEDGTADGFNPNIGRWPANVLLDEAAAAMLPDAPGQLAEASTNQESRRNQNVYGGLKRGSVAGALRQDCGSAARFFYTSKADGKERGTGNVHPTVKPLDLMRYLCRLVAPPGPCFFVDPFTGSGSTLAACKALGIRAVGIELSEQYAEIAAKRLSQDVLSWEDTAAHQTAG